MQEKFFSAKSEDGLLLYISFRLIQNYSSWVYSDFSLDFLMIPFVMGFSPLYSPSFLHLNLHVLIRLMVLILVLSALS